MPVIAFPHAPPSKGGPGSFQKRFEKELIKRNWDIIYPGEKIKPDVVFVVGGTKKIGWLLKHKIIGIPIVYRLDGINWLHRKIKVPLKSWFINEIRNLLSQFIRTFLASHIIYQSKFVESWWSKKGWTTNAENNIIYNGVNLNEFKPAYDDAKDISLLCLEGTVDYSPYAVKLLNSLSEKISHHSSLNSLTVYGSFHSKDNQEKLHPEIKYRGIVSKDELPHVYRNAIYLSLDVNAACPNTVIEALASGIPVIGYDTGALNELVSEKAGEVVPYGSNPWNLEFPDVEKLFMAAIKVYNEWPKYSRHARQRAEKNFDMNDVAHSYIQVIEKALR